MHRDTPCPFCHKNELTHDRFICYDAFRPQDNTFHRVQGKLIQWNGRKAQVRYVNDLADTVNVSSQRDREIAYAEQLRIRRELAGDALVSAHYNLTQNFVSDVSGESKEFVDLVLQLSIDDILKRVSTNPFSKDEALKLSEMQDRSSLIQQFYAGKTHIVVRHYIESYRGYFEGIFDLMQNPITFDVEAYAALRDITDVTMRSDIVERLFGIDYDTIVTIDAETGEAHPYLGNHIDTVIAEQKSARDNVSGIEAYLRKYCVSRDIERVIKETSLSYVKEHLKKHPTASTTYLLWQDGEVIYKRVLYTYLDRRKTTILCTMQKLTDAYLKIIEEAQKPWYSESRNGGTEHA